VKGSKNERSPGSRQLRPGRGLASGRRRHPIPAGVAGGLLVLLVVLAANARLKSHATNPAAPGGSAPAAGVPAPAAGVRDSSPQSPEPRPNPTLTPGEAFAGVGAAQVCTRGWATAHRDVPESEKEQVFRKYGLAWSSRHGYEVDHLISLELGGDNSIRNLWPEINDHPRPGYLNTKDILENRLHDLVCDGQLDLGTAQRSIVTDWWAAYQRYVISH
jgi:hypothetical protein